MVMLNEIKESNPYFSATIHNLTLIASSCVFHFPQNNINEKKEKNIYSKEKKKGAYPLDTYLIRVDDQESNHYCQENGGQGPYGDRRITYAGFG